MPKFSHPLSADDVRKVFTYDPDTGHFRRASDRKRWKTGELAGHRRPDGYMGLSVDGVAYKAHRLAWLYVYGEYPNGDLDHINCNPSDNRIANLRLTSPSNNNINKHRAQSNNLSCGMLGVTWCRQRNKWQVRLVVNGKTKHRSFHTDPIEGAKAYAAAKTLHMKEIGML